MADEPQLTAAQCRTCGRQLTVTEFQACRGIGHYCATHLPAAPAPRPRSTPASSSSGKRPAGSRRGRRVSESGVIEYSCKAQFARNGVTRSGRLTTDHPACMAGGAVFVYDEVGYGPGEIVMLFIKDPDGRSLAERTGFRCHR